MLTKQKIFDLVINNQIEQLKFFLLTNKKLKEVGYKIEDYVNAVDDNGQFPLIIAAGKGFIEAAQVLIDAGANINQTQSVSHGTALHLAAQNSLEEMVKFLLKAGAEKEAATGRNWTPMYLAADHNRPTIIKILHSAGADVNKGDIADGTTPAMIAAYGGNKEAFTALIECQAELTLSRKDGRTALHCAAQCGHVQIMRLILEKSAYVDYQTISGMTPIFLASQYGHLDAVELLIQYGANLDIPVATLQNQTAIAAATRNGHVEIVKRLFAAKAKLDIPIFIEDDEINLVHVAARYNQATILTIFCTQRPSFVNALSSKGATPAYYAAEYGSADALKKLEALGANLKFINLVTGHSLPHIASIYGHGHIIKILHVAGADLNTSNKKLSNKTPGYLAVENKQPEAVLALTECKATFEIPDTMNGLYPIHLAVMGRDLQSLALLIAAQVDLNKQRASDGATAAFAAVINEDTEALKMLISAGVDLNIPARDGTQNGIKPREFATNRGYKTIVEALDSALTFSERLEKIKYSGEIPDEYLDAVTFEIMNEPVMVSDGNIYDKYTFNRFEEIKVNNFIKRKNPKDQFVPLQPVAFACKELRTRIANFVSEKEKIILDKKNKLDAILKKYNTYKSEDEDLAHVLRMAAKQNDYASIEFLIGYDKKIIDRTGIFDKTALHFAIENDAVESVEVLKKAHPKTDIKDTNGNTAIDYAKKKNNLKILKLLEVKFEANEQPGTSQEHPLKGNISSQEISTFIEWKKSEATKKDNDLLQQKQGKTEKTEEKKYTNTSESENKLSL